MWLVLDFYILVDRNVGGAWLFIFQLTGMWEVLDFYILVERNVTGDCDILYFSW
jgi:hypothetical protein